MAITQRDRTIAHLRFDWAKPGTPDNEEPAMLTEDEARALVARYYSAIVHTEGMKLGGAVSARIVGDAENLVHVRALSDYLDRTPEADHEDAIAVWIGWNPDGFPRTGDNWSIDDLDDASWVAALERGRSAHPGDAPAPDVDQEAPADEPSPAEADAGDVDDVVEDDVGDLNTNAADAADADDVTA